MTEIVNDTLRFLVFGEDAKDLSERLGIVMSHEETDLNAKVSFRHKYAGGIEIEVELPAKKKANGPLLEAHTQ